MATLHGEVAWGQGFGDEFPAGGASGPLGPGQVQTASTGRAAQASATAAAFGGPVQLHTASATTKRENLRDEG